MLLAVGVGFGDAGRAATLRLGWLKGVQGNTGGQNLGSLHWHSESSYPWKSPGLLNSGSFSPRLQEPNAIARVLPGRTEETRLSHFPHPCPRAEEARSDHSALESPGQAAAPGVTEPAPSKPQDPGEGGVRRGAESCLLSQKGRCERLTGRIHTADPRPIQGREPVSTSAPPLEKRGAGLPPRNKASFMPPPREPGLWVGHVPSWWGTSGHTYSTPLRLHNRALVRLWTALF